MNQAANPKLDDIRVRQAIALRDQQAGAGRLDAARGHRGRHPVRPADRRGLERRTSRSTSTTWTRRRQLLKEAGAEDLTLKFNYPTEVTRPYMPNTEDLFEIDAADLEEAGITVKRGPPKWSPDYLDTIQGTGDARPAPARLDR